MSKVESLDPYGLETFDDYKAQIEREARISELQELKQTVESIFEESWAPLLIQHLEYRIKKLKGGVE